MSEFTPSKKTAQDFHDGVKYKDGYDENTGDMVRAADINGVIEGTLYAEETADSANQKATNALAQVEQVINDKTLLPQVQSNLYNLGAFDTFTDNGNGTGIVTRATYNIDSKNLSITQNAPNQDIWYVALSSLGLIGKVETGDYAAKCSISSRAYVSSTYNTLNWIGLGTTDLATAQRKLRNAVTEVHLLPEYQYTEPVITDTPIHTANQDQEIYYNEEWKKGLNLINKVINGYELSNNNIVVNALWYVTDYIAVKPNTTYTSSGLSSQNVYFYNSNKTFISNANTATFITPNNCAYVILNSFISGYPNPMLNEGDHTYSYKPYYGQIVREIDFDRLILQKEYPVGGKPYIQYPGQPTPAERWAGTTWERDATYNGRMLIGATGAAGTATVTNPYPLGSTGGSPDAVVVEHRHVQSVSPSSGSDSGVSTWDASTLYNGGGKALAYTSDTGISGVGKNIPPYLAINYWKRIS